jgi:hypothetical protein
MTLAVGGVAIVDAIVLDAEAADRDGHPAVLVAMIVDAAALADFPADGHAFEESVFKNEIAGVIAFGEVAIFFEGFGEDGVVEDVVLNVVESEVALGDGGEIFDPVGDVELLDSDFLWHRRVRRSLEYYSAEKRSGEVKK